jgi:hypothetical protein
MEKQMFVKHSTGGLSGWQMADGILQSHLARKNRGHQQHAD